MNTIEVRNLSKKFGSFISVDNISFNVAKGEVFGFLGANGAGKSTTIRMLCGILMPTSGAALVNGFSIVKDPESIKRTIGYMSQKFSLYNDLTVNENINFFGGVYGLLGKKFEQRKDWVLEMSGLGDRKNFLASELSVGYKQRLALGCAVIHEPELVFLDEPTGGVDPVSRKKFWDLINSLSDEGTTVFVTTHYLDEAEFCNEIVLIDAGKLIAAGSPKELKEKYITDDVIQIRSSDSYRTIDLLKDQPFTDSISIFGNSIHLLMKPVSETAGSSADSAVKIMNVLSSDNELKIFSVEKISPSLEDVFVYLIEKKSAVNA